MLMKMEILEGEENALTRGSKKAVTAVMNGGTGTLRRIDFVVEQVTVCGDPSRSLIRKTLVYGFRYALLVSLKKITLS